MDMADRVSASNEFFFTDTLGVSRLAAVAPIVHAWDGSTGLPE